MTAAALYLLLARRPDGELRVVAELADPADAPATGEPSAGSDAGSLRALGYEVLLVAAVAACLAEGAPLSAAYRKRLELAVERIIAEVNRRIPMHGRAFDREVQQESITAALAELDRRAP